MGISRSREGAALRSSRIWLLLLCPEIPDRSGKWGKGAESVAVSRRRQGALAGRTGAMAWRMRLLRSNMASLGHTRAAKHTRAGRRGLFLPMTMRSSSPTTMRTESLGGRTAAPMTR